MIFNKNNLDLELQLCLYIDVIPFFGQNWNINKSARNYEYQDWRSVGIKATIDIVKILLNSDRDEIDWR